MAASHTATDRLKREKWTKSDDIGDFVAGPLPSICSAEQRLGDHKIQDNGEVKVLLHEVW
jgi:hypothetical protein